MNFNNFSLVTFVFVDEECAQIHLMDRALILVAFSLGIPSPERTSRDQVHISPIHLVPEFPEAVVVPPNGSSMPGGTFGESPAEALAPNFDNSTRNSCVSSSSWVKVWSRASYPCASARITRELPAQIGRQATFSVDYCGYTVDLDVRDGSRHERQITLEFEQMANRGRVRRDYRDALFFSSLNPFSCTDARVGSWFDLRVAGVFSAFARPSMSTCAPAGLDSTFTDTS